MNSLISHNQIQTMSTLPNPASPAAANVELADNANLPFSILIPLDPVHPEKGWERIEIGS